MNPMKKYYVGLLILGVITLGLTVYVISLGIQSKQDVKTEKSAQEISNKINSYISKKQKIPSSLSEVGANDVPDTIKYTKLSEEKYKFCVTYKAAKGYGSGDITSVLTNAAMSRAYGGASAYEDTSYEPSSLYPSYTHKKGENCQTIKPYIYSYDNYNNYDYGSSKDEYCNEGGKYYEQYKDYCPASTTPTITQ